MTPDRLSDADLDQSILYALGALEPADLATLERRLGRGEPALAAEVQRMQTVAALLGQAAVVTPPAALRRRLLDRLRTERVVVVIRAAQGEWRAGIVPGMRTKSLFLDEPGARATSLVRMDPGARYPAHRHAGTEELYVLEGTLIVEGHLLGAGDFCAAPEGTSHAPTWTDRGCTFLLTGSTDDAIVPELASPSGGLIFVRAQDHDWRESATPGVATRLIFKDVVRGTRTMLVRMAAGARLPQHHHASAEHIYMLEGDGRVGGVMLGAGDFYGAPEGTAHDTTWSAGGCTFLLMASRLEAVA